MLRTACQDSHFPKGCDMEESKPNIAQGHPGFSIFGNKKRILFIDYKANNLKAYFNLLRYCSNFAPLTKTSLIVFLVSSSSIF